MSIEASIHEIISDNTNPDAAALVTLLPADRIVTGRMQSGVALPWCTVNLESSQSNYRSSNGSARSCAIRFQVWHDQHQKGIAIRDAIQTLFENKDFKLTAENLLSTRVDNDFAVQEPDGTWQFIVDIDVITAAAKG